MKIQSKFTTKTISESLDTLYEEAKLIVKLNNMASPALLQRKLNISYENSIRFIEKMELEGMVGPPDSKHYRKVLDDQNDPVELSSKFNDNKKIGLSEENIRFITGSVFVILLLFGPSYYYIFLRVAYLIILPLITWLILKYLGRHWKAGELENDRLLRGINVLIAAALFFSAYQSYASRYHSVCNQSIQTRDGTECVGDYETVSGGNKSGAFVQAGLGAAFLWYGIFRRENPIRK